LWQIQRVTAFDAELYLRFAGERLLGEETSALTVMAQALVAVRAIDDAAAVAVLEDYVLASALRGDVTSVYSLEGADVEDRAAVEPLEPARVVSCERELALGFGTLGVSHVSLGRDETNLAVVLDIAPTGTRRRGHRRMLNSGPLGVTLSDDRGTRRIAHFSGGGSDSRLEGHLHTHPGLHVETAYVEVDGHRIELVGDVAPSEQWIEELPAQDPALRFLWQCVTPEANTRESVVVEPAIESLLAAGALSPDDPALADLRAATEAMTSGALYGGPVSMSKALPEPWHSVFHPSRTGGPVGTLAVNAATPVFDGFAVAVTALQSQRDAWAVEVEVAPGLERYSPFETPRARSRQLTWWAADDRGKPFLGTIDTWSDGEHSGRGSIQFTSALDPKAKYIDLLPTAATRRAVIRVPLEWS
jgi:hypothetical protein